MSPDDDMPGRLGPYRLLDRIGEGGMGVVYLARDRDQCAVAIKVLKPGVAGEPNALRRLVREVETMQRVRSPFVAEVLGADLVCDTPYIVTRYVPGRTLAQVIAEDGPLRGAALAGLARGLADALAAVHAAGGVHRDLKPSNVMLVGGAPVVIDFGIAQGPDATRLTMTGMFMGTPGYLSPEVIEGQPSSRASDVHAWGATVAFAATGRPPFGSGSYETIFYKIVNGQPDLGGAPAALLPLLAAALARDPAHRPPAVQLSALAAVLEPAALVPGPAGVVLPLAGMGTLQATRADLGHGQPPAALPGAVLSGGAVPPGGAVNGSVINGSAVNGSAVNGVAAGGAAAAAGGALARGALAGDALAGGAMAGGAMAGPLAAGQAYGVPAYGHPGSSPVPAGTRPADFADVLPPVSYRPGAGGPASAAPGALDPGRGRQAATAPAGGHALLAAASMVFLAGVSVVLPVVGTLLSLALVALLRAGGAARRGAALRRSTRGARAGDAVVAAVTFPWFLVRSVAGMLLMAPVAAAVGALAAGITMILVSVDRLPHALAFAAGTLVAFYGLGPRSGRARGQLSHLYAVVTRTRIAQAAAIIAVVALALGAATAALSWPSLYWPVRAPVSITHLGAGYPNPLRLPGPLRLPSPLRLLHGGRALLSHLLGH